MPRSVPEGPVGPPVDGRPVDGPPVDGRPTSAGPSLARSGLLLAVATTTANACGYGFTLVLGRALGRGDFGAVGALLNLTLIAAVPPLALQLVAARRVARATSSAPPGAPTTVGEARPDLPQVAHALLRTALLMTAVLGGLGVVTAPVTAWFLHLDGTGPALLAVALAVAGVGSALGQGVLQGAERFAALAATYLVSGGTRFAAGALAAVAGWGQVGVLAATWVAAVITALVAGLLAVRTLGSSGAAVLRAARRAIRRPATLRLGRDVRDSVRSMAGLFVLLNLDLLLARHYLPPDVSGLYAVGALFAKGAFWAPQFLATLLYPGLATPHRRRRSLGRGLALTVASGVLLTAACAALATPAVRLAFGSPYLPLAPHLWVFAALGATLSVVQILVLARVAAGDGAWTGLTAAVVVGVWSLVVWRMHHTVVDVAGTALAGALLLAAVGTAGVRGELSPPAPDAA